MHRTLGDLVDALVTTNLKLWFTQEEVYKAAGTKQGLSPDLTGRLASLNLQRNRLMAALDETLDRAAREGRADVDPRTKLV